MNLFFCKRKLIKFFLFVLIDEDGIYLNLQEMLETPETDAKKLDCNPPNILRRTKKRRTSDDAENEMVSKLFY